MDRGIYKSHALTLKLVTFKIILAIKGGYYKQMCAFLIDCSDAFQTTRTDVDPTKPKLYCWPAPGFGKYAPDGTPLACEVHVGMQGRIDATMLFNEKLFGLLFKAGFTRSLWDPQLAIYHNCSLSGSSASLTDMIASVHAATDSPPQQPPIGICFVGWHVDDGTGLAVDVGCNLNPANNRMVQYLVGSIQVIYATTMTGWHGHKTLGFTLALDDAIDTVSMSDPDMVEQLSKEIFAAMPSFTPKHIMMPTISDSPLGTVPSNDDPSRDAVLARMTKTRHVLGKMVYISNAYPTAVFPTKTLCAHMLAPDELDDKSLAYIW